jgi:Putative zinc-finger
MNCEQYQQLISELVDDRLGSNDQLELRSHIEGCPSCAAVERDFESILSFCQSQREEYMAPPNAAALWLRIRNVVEAEWRETVPAVTSDSRSNVWTRWMSRSWQLSLPQLAGTVAAVALVVSLITTVGMRWLQSAAASSSTPNPPVASTQVSSPSDRTWQQQQAINYWNERVEVNRVRWSPQMRDTFDRNMSVIDQAVNDSLRDLNRNPHDEVSEEMLNAALNEKLAMLREFSEL